MANPFARIYRGIAEQIAVSQPTVMQESTESTERTDRNLQTALAEMRKIEQIYAPGGSFLKGAEATYEKGKKKSLAATTQAMVSRGLFGTTTSANVEKAYEEDIGAPWRLQIEDVRMQRLSEALQGKASVLQNIATIEEQRKSFTNQLQMLREQLATQRQMGFAQIASQQAMASQGQKLQLAQLGLQREELEMNRPKIRTGQTGTFERMW